MTQELIPVRQGQIGGASCHVVNGRRLHKFLSVRSEFGHWIAHRIRQYGFTEGVDFTFVKISARRSHARGASISYSYDLTLDMAKELAMVERNDKGREARRYFIECERQLRSALVPSVAQRQVQNRLLKIEAGVVRSHRDELIEHRNRLLAEAAESARRLLHLETEVLSLFRENRELLHFKVSVLSGDEAMRNKQRELPLGGAS